MSRREEYEMKTEALITPIVDEKGFELVDVEYVKEGSNWYLRAYVDRKSTRLNSSHNRESRMPSSA